jgi:methyl-accepting chemotaxis protein
MKSKANRRMLKNFFISKELQRPMIMAHLAYLLFVLVAVIATVLSPYYADIFSESDLWAKHFSAKTFMVLLGRLSITCVFIVFISFFHFIIFSHKFCGPLVNIGHTIAKISEGDFTRKIHLRKGDFLKKEAGQINAMMKSLSDSIAIIQKDHYLLLEDMEKYIQAHDNHADIAVKMEAFRHMANRCQVQLDKFKIDHQAADEIDSGQCRTVADTPSQPTAGYKKQYGNAG